jgi:hypothetical protein
MEEMGVSFLGESTGRPRHLGDLHRVHRAEEKEEK